MRRKGGRARRTGRDRVGLGEDGEGKAEDKREDKGGRHVREHEGSEGEGDGEVQVGGRRHAPSPPSFLRSRSELNGNQQKTETTVEAKGLN